MRFALLESKLALVTLFKKFNLDLADETKPEIELDPGNQLATALHGLRVKPTKRTIE